MKDPENCKVEKCKYKKKKVVIVLLITQISA